MHEYSFFYHLFRSLDRRRRRRCHVCYHEELALKMATCQLGGRVDVMDDCVAGTQREFDLSYLPVLVVGKETE